MILTKSLSVANPLLVWLKIFLMVLVTLRLNLDLTKALLQVVNLHRRLAVNRGSMRIVKTLIIALQVINNKLGAKDISLAPFLLLLYFNQYFYYLSVPFSRLYTFIAIRIFSDATK